MCTVPELNVSMDTYRIGTLLEMVRELAFSLADVGLNTRILVQPSMGEGIFKSLPLSLSGVMAILKGMDWGEGFVGTRVNFGHVRDARRLKIQEFSSWKLKAGWDGYTHFRLPACVRASVQLLWMFV